MDGGNDIRVPADVGHVERLKAAIATLAAKPHGCEHSTMPTTDNIDASPAAGTPRFGPPTTANPFWRLVVIGGAAFGLSCLLWLTAGYANPDAPGNQWLNRHGLKLVVVTASAAVVSAIAAMATDRWQTARLNRGNVNSAVDVDADTTEVA